MKENNEVVVNAIYYWDTQNIWQYIKDNNITTNPLYEKGYTRVGCIGCPLATYSKVLKEFSDYPKYKQAYLKAFEKMLEVRKAAGMCDQDKEGYHKWTDAETVFEWWIEEYRRNVKGQLTFDDI